MKYVLIVIANLMVLFACNDDDGASQNPVLPDKTMTGRNTIGFYLKPMDEQQSTWVPYAVCGGVGSNPCGAISSDYYYPNNQEEVNEFFFQLSRKTDNMRTSFFLGVVDIEGIGDYSDKVVQFQFVDSTNEEIIYNVRSNSNVELIITKFDEQEEIVSGTFSARLFSDEDANTYIDIENGRFDLRFDACVCM